MASGQPSLYGEQAPTGSAFLRVINASQHGIRAMVGDLPRLPLGAAEVSAFRTVPRVVDRSVAVEVQAGTLRTRENFRVAAGSLTTLLVADGPEGLLLRALPEPNSFNQSRGLLAFTNAAPRCAASLVVEPTGTTVFADVPSGESRARTVGPVSTTLSARCGDAVVPLALEGLQAGERYSIWLMLSSAGLRAVLTHDILPSTRRPGRIP